MPTPTRTIVMTGASRGIGRRAAEAVLRQAPDAVLVLLARDGGGSDLGHSNRNVRILDVDLAAAESIRTATTALRRDLRSGALPPLTAVVANAGMQLLRGDTTTADGLETTFAVNVVANHVLVEGLRESLSPGARIVVTTSDTHFGDFAHNMGLVPGPIWRDPDALALPGADRAAGTRTAGQTAYSTSKLAVIYWVHALARRLPQGTEIFSFNPGLVPGTGLARDFSTIGRFVFRRVMPLLVLTRFASTVATAGDNLASAVLDAVPADSGAYINGRRPERLLPGVLRRGPRRGVVADAGATHRRPVPPRQAWTSPRLRGAVLTDGAASTASHAARERAHVDVRNVGAGIPAIAIDSHLFRYPGIRSDSEVQPARERHSTDPAHPGPISRNYRTRGAVMWSHTPRRTKSTGLPVRAGTAVALAAAAVGLTGVAWSAPTPSVSSVRLVAHARLEPTGAGRLDEPHRCPDYKGPGTKDCLPSDTGIDGKPDSKGTSPKYTCTVFHGPGGRPCPPSKKGKNGKPGSAGGGVKDGRHVCPDYKGPGTKQCLPSKTGLDGKTDRGNHRPGSHAGPGTGGGGPGGPGSGTGGGGNGQAGQNHQNGGK